MSKVAKLSEKELTNVQECEKELGKILIAYEKSPQFAKLSGDQLKILQETEKKLGGRLVAYT